MSYPFLDETSSSELAIVTFLYLLVAFLVILPPSELISAGFSLQNLFSYFFAESEAMSFVRYHIKRISIKYLVHSCLPLGYLCVLLYFCDWSQGFSTALVALFTRTSILLRLSVVSCVFIPLVTSLIVFRWHINDCFHHPLVRQLRLFIQTNNQAQEATWHTVESSINTEFRRFDKFTCGEVTSNVRCYVLDSWILKCSMYHVHVAQQSNVHVELVEARDIRLQETNEEVSLTVQYLNITIKSSDSRIQPFYIR